MLWKERRWNKRKTEPSTCEDPLKWMAMFLRQDDWKVNACLKRTIFLFLHISWLKIPAALSMSAPLSLSSSSTGQSCSTTWGWLVGVMLFSFCFLSISQIESSERFICNGDERTFVNSLFLSLHISLPLLRGAWRRRLSLFLSFDELLTTLVAFVCRCVIFSFSSSLALFLPFSLSLFTCQRETAIYK